MEVLDLEAFIPGGKIRRVDRAKYRRRLFDRKPGGKR